ncbi:MAG TPA: glycosyltransferase [Methylophilaceae bacterium]
MRFLFVHQNFPSQFRHISKDFAFRGHEVLAIGDMENFEQQGIPHSSIQRFGYEPPPKANAAMHHYLQSYEVYIRRGQAVVRIALELVKQGFHPDVVIAHPGWGEALFLKDVFPHARHIHYCEFFYRAEGADVDFDPEFPMSMDDRLRIRIKNSTQLTGLDYADAGLSPTVWQANLYPESFRPRIQIIHEGIDTNIVKPDANASVQIKDKVLTVKDEVITFVARNLEPYRGYHIFMRMLPALLSERPAAQVVIVGGDEFGYGKPAPEGKSWRDFYFEPIRHLIDESRVHFLGKLPHPQYLKVLQISTAHVYLTYPFVLSWSMLEAMAAGCLVIGSATPPVKEVLIHESNGLLCDFFDVDAWVKCIADALQRRDEMQPLRIAARNTIIEHYDLHTICLPRQLKMLTESSLM